MKRKVLLALIAMSLPACSTMGTTDYEVEPFQLADGSVVCCKAKVHNSKDYEKLKFKLIMKSDGTVEAVLDETGISASDPAAMNAQNNGKMLDVMKAVMSKGTN